MSVRSMLTNNCKKDDDYTDNQPSETITDFDGNYSLRYLVLSYKSDQFK